MSERQPSDTPALIESLREARRKRLAAEREEAAKPKTPEQLAVLDSLQRAKDANLQKMEELNEEGEGTPAGSTQMPT
ncbi:MAG TPA: hypothetical protein VFG18_04930 [Xanthomonadaceae bacterium]|nr:hypothetical protein [Xanthomonadaceae bacterium]